MTVIIIIIIFIADAVSNYLLFSFTVWPVENVQYESFYYANESIDYNSIYSNNHQQRQPNTFSNKLNYLVTIFYIFF